MNLAWGSKGARWLDRIVGMVREARVEFEGAVSHVMDRGDRREAIFGDDPDRERFLLTPGEVCGRVRGCAGNRRV